jgi:hypothetical protein
MRSSQNRLIWILLALVAFLLLVAVAAVAIYLVLRQQPSSVTVWQDPVAQVDPDQVSPDLALYPLAGALQLETIDAAIANGDYETAYASLVFGLDPSDAQRIGRLIRLGRGFASVENLDRASLSYQQVYDLAVLSPNLSDPARADALLAAGGGWAQVGQEGQALIALDQVYTIAVESPYLQKAQRRDLLSALEIQYGALGALEAAEACRRKIIELDQGIGSLPEALPFESPALPFGPRDLPAGTEPISSPEVGALEETRRQAAFALLQISSQGLEPLPEQVTALAQALLAEDAAKLVLYRQELEATTQPSHRINVHWHIIRWLTLKYQVAAKAHGLSIVPEWEAQVADIQSALSTAYEDLFFDYEDLVTALPDAALMEPGRYRVRRLVTLAGRLGHYPNYPEQQMADKIRDAVSALIAAGFVERLYVDATDVGAMGLHFTLRPADEYGLPAQEP